MQKVKITYSVCFRTLKSPKKEIGRIDQLFESILSNYELKSVNYMNWTENSKHKLQSFKKWVGSSLILLISSFSTVKLFPE